MRFLAASVFTPILVSSFLLPSALSQTSRVEIFGGYSVEHIAPCGTQTTYGQGESCGLEEGELASSNNYYNGWEAAATWGAEARDLGLRPFFGITADFSGHYGIFGSQSARYSFLFGPTVAFHLPKLRPFAHALFGLTKETASGGYSPYNFSVAEAVLGGGLDLNVSRRFAVRLIQADYEWQKNPTSSLPGPHGARLSAGVVFKF
jgi:hypothetical protein